MEKGPKAAVEEPSETVMVMLLYVPMSAAVGVPEIRPVDRSIAAHAGKLAAANVKFVLSGSLAEGSKEKDWEGATVLPGLP
jgi:hypothetical protein